MLKHCFSVELCLEMASEGNVALALISSVTFTVWESVVDGCHRKVKHSVRTVAKSTSRAFNKYICTTEKFILKIP